MSEPLWLEQLQPASWREMRVHVDSIDVTAGDNTVLREYPFRDLPALFRMGEGTEEIKFSCYVVGDDYHQQRDALRALLHNVPDEGGVLVHPTAGSIRCFVHGKYHIKEAPVAEGGVARFDITFIRAQPRDQQGGNVAAVSSEYAAIRAADELEQVAIDEFAANWGETPLEGLPSWARQSVLDRLKALTDLSWLQAGADGLRDALDFGAAAQALSSLVLDPSALIAAPLQLARNMAALFTAPLNWVDNQVRAFSNAGAQIRGTVFELRHEGRRAQAWFDRMTGGGGASSSRATSKPVWDIGRSLPASNVLTQAITPSSLGSGGYGLYMFGRGDAVPPSPKQVRVNELTGALDALVETLATCQALRAATQIPLTQIDQAFALRNTIHAQMLRLARNAQASRPYLVAAGGDSGVARLPYIDALRRAHTASLADLQARSFELARLTSYTPQTWQPAVYISWRVYGTAAYADEIMAMNPQVQNPLLCAPGVALRLVRHD